MATQSFEEILLERIARLEQRIADLESKENAGSNPITSGRIAYGDANNRATTDSALLYDATNKRVLINAPGTATLTVGRGGAPNVGGTAEFAGTTRTSHINFSADEHTYIRGGKSTSIVYINDGGQGVALGPNVTTENVMGVNGVGLNAGVALQSRCVSGLVGLRVWNNALNATILDVWDGREVYVNGTLLLLNLGTPPAAPANYARLFVDTNTLGKHRLGVRFPNGSIYYLAAEP